jgi:glyoxylase-like metal-dependent hydrolase (beta-lactamase superfamily II)
MNPPEDFDPPAGQAQTLAPGLQRILAPNPSAMTWRGTNTYLVGTRNLAVIDPGPSDPAHLQAILNSLRPGQSISHILVTHAHLDHSPLAADLARETGAPILAYGDALAGRSAVMQGLAESGMAGGGEGVDHSFRCDIALADGACVQGDGWQITAHWTPGHFGNHLAFQWGDAVFSGDLVMGWASSLVSPPDGDLTQFMASCAKLRALNARILHAGHGAPVTRPSARIDWLIAHRNARETAILQALAQGPATAQALARSIYTETPPALLPAATRNVFAHLVDLTGKNRVEPQGSLAYTAVFKTIS